MAKDIAAARSAGFRQGFVPLFRRRPLATGSTLGVVVLLLLLVLTLALRPSRKPLAVAPPIVIVAAPAPVKPTAPAPPPVARAPTRAELSARPSDPDSVSLRALAERLQAPGAELENPCTVTSGSTCILSAMDPFFTALDKAKTKNEPTVVLALGNSLIAGDGVVDVVRARLTDRFGEAGRGLVLADRMAAYGGRTRCASAASGWLASTFAPPYKLRWPFGLSGVHHTSDRNGAFSTFKLRGETKADVFWLDRPEAVPVDVSVDGQLLGTLEPTHEAGGHIDGYTLPNGSHELTLTAKGKGAVIHGVALEKQQSGIVLDMLGVPSADASIFLQAQEDIFVAQVKSRRPSLVMLMFGGNETKRIAWGRSSEDKVVHDLRKLIARVKSASDAACWVVGPLDAVVKRGENPYAQRPELSSVIAMEKQIALEEGCGWFDLYRAMGGAGSVKRFDAAGLMHPDRVHPKGRGLDVLGQLISDALFDAYAKSGQAANAEAAR